MKKILAVFIMLMFCLSCSSSSYKYINDEQVYNNIIIKTKDGIVVYGTTWCPNCKQYIEQLKEIKDDLRGEVDIYLIEFPYAPSDGEFLDYEKETYKNHSYGCTPRWSMVSRAFRSTSNVAGAACLFGSLSGYQL